MVMNGTDVFGNPQAVGITRNFLLPFQVTSVLILIAIMGAVVLARRGEIKWSPLSYYLVLSAILFACGVARFLIKRNIITIFLSIESTLNGVNLSFVAFAAQPQVRPYGHILRFFRPRGRCCGGGSRTGHYHLCVPPRPARG